MYFKINIFRACSISLVVNCLKIRCQNGNVRSVTVVRGSCTTWKANHGIAHDSHLLALVGLKFKLSWFEHCGHIVFEIGLRLILLILYAHIKLENINI